MAKILPFPPRAAEAPRLTDEALVAACGASDPTALGMLFDRFHDDVLRFLARVCVTAGEDLDDLVQKTFIEVHRSAQRFQGSSSVKSWIFGIALNVSRHHVRSANRRKRALKVLSEFGGETSRQPDELTESRQLLARVADELANLPPDLRTAFVLCEIEELSGVEAAKTLGINEGTLRRRLHDARKRLRRAIEGGSDEEG